MQLKTFNPINSKIVVYPLIYSILLLIPAIHNSYPLAFSDTGTYIRSGFEFSIPADRPVFYGLFLRFSSLKVSFWFSIFIQALISGFALWQIIQLLSNQNSKIKILPFLIFTTCLIFSGLPYYSSILLSDFAVAPALVFLFLFYCEKSKVNSLLYSISIIVLSLFHLSLLMSLIIMLFLAWILYLFGILKFQSHKINQITFIILSSLILLIGTNYWVTKKVQITPSGHLFLSAKFIENGLYKKVLDDKCAASNWNICKYKDSLPVYGTDFLWSDNSILYKLGGWDKNVEEYKTINSSIMMPGKYSFDLLQDGFKGMQKQLLLNYFGGEILNSYDLKSPPGDAINQFMNSELDKFLNSNQNKAKINRKLLFIWSNFSEYFYYLMLLGCLLQVIFNRKNRYLNGFILLIFSYLIIQSLFIGTFSIEDARYNSRLLWLFIPAGLLSFEGILGLIKNHYVVYLSNKTGRS